MATDGPDPKPCDPEIFKSGEVVFVTHSIPSNAMEGWVQSVARHSGQRADWFFCGGRAVVKAIGDLERVRESIEILKPEHDRLREES